MRYLAIFLLPVVLGVSLSVYLLLSKNFVAEKMSPFTVNESSSAPVVPAPTKEPAPVGEVDSSAVQQPGRTIVVDSVKMPDKGFAVVKKYEPQTGDIIGQSSLLGRGAHNSVRIDLNIAAQTKDQLFVVLYSDDGDGKFDPDKDLPFADEDGSFYFARVYIR